MVPFGVLQEFNFLWILLEVLWRYSWGSGSQLFFICIPLGSLFP